MGWTYRNRKLRHQTPVEYMIDQLTCETEATSTTVIAATAVGGTIYAAIRQQDRLTGRSFVLCGVILFKNSAKDGFGYKIMSERMGPYEVDCPGRIMRLLSPISDIEEPSCAAEWRGRVAAGKAAKAANVSQLVRFRPGDVIRRTKPAKFTSFNINEDRFTVIGFEKRTMIFAPMCAPAFRCRLRKDSLVDATVEHTPA